MRSVRLFGKSIPLLAIVAIAMSAGMVGAALLSYYGKITTTVDVQQSVLVDDQDYTGEITDEITESAPGGETFCFKHTLTNQASIPATVNFETEYWPEGEGITTTIVKPTGYSEEATSVTYNFYKPNGIDVGITVEDGECSVTWTFDFPINEDPSNGNMGYGLVISLDGVHPAFQIHNNDGTDASHPWGTHLYSEWGPEGTGYNGWHTGDTNTPVSGIDWIEATGGRYKDGKLDCPEPNPNGIFTVTIDKCKLASLGNCEDIWWAVHFGAGGFSDYGGLSKYPEAWVPWSGDSSTIEHAQILEAVTNMTIPSGTILDFYICYSFDIAIVPGTYVITTKVVPA